MANNIIGNSSLLISHHGLLTNKTCLIKGNLAHQSTTYKEKIYVIFFRVKAWYYLILVGLKEMLRALRFILTIGLFTICISIRGQDTIDIQLFKLIFSNTETIEQRADKILATCNTNIYAPGVILRFDSNTCAGTTSPILISPVFDRSDRTLFPDPNVAQTGKTILTSPYI